MRPVQDIDAVILMATALASKRRAAELVEIVAAADLIQGMIPFADKLGDAIQRLSAAGLIIAADDGFTLAPAAQEIMGKPPKKATTEDRLIAIKHDLASYNPGQQCAAILLGAEQLVAAIRAHKSSRKASGQNLLMPKPKPDRHFKVEGRWRRAPATR